MRVGLNFHVSLRIRDFLTEIARARKILWIFVYARAESGGFSRMGIYKRSSARPRRPATFLGVKCTFDHFPRCACWRNFGPSPSTFCYLARRLLRIHTVSLYRKIFHIRESISPNGLSSYRARKSIQNILRAIYFNVVIVTRARAVYSRPNRTNLRSARKDFNS